MLEDKYTMQNQCYSNVDDKFVMNFGAFDAESLFNAPMGGTMNMVGVKRSAHEAGLVDRDDLGLSSDDDGHILKKDDHHHQHKLHATSSDRENQMHHHHHSQTSLDHHSQQSADSKQTVLPNGKKTKGRVKIKMEFIDNKLRRYTTFSKRKTGIMKKAYELSTLTGTQVMLLVASETGHVYTFATRKLQPMITSEAGKALIQTCLNSPDPPSSSHHHPHHNHHDQRMSATGYEETELTYAVTEEEHKVRQMMYSSTGGHINAMHHSPTIASPSPHLALQPHPHPQYQTHPSINQPPHINASSGHPHHLNPTNHADHISMNHHGPHLAGPPPTPLSAQSPLPPHSPICTSSSPTSPYPHHHPHHAALQAHTR